MNNMLFVFMFLSTIFLGSCAKEDVSSNVTDGLVITNGQSFGMCVGPCQQELIINGNKATFRVLTRPNRGVNDNTKETIYEEILSASEINSIIQNVDFENFKNLKEVYGCPDCADGGAEYIEIQKGDTKHKVTFEYGKSVKEIEKLITLLREKRLKLSEKYVK